MGIRCIKSQEQNLPISSQLEKDPIFTYQNMIGTVSDRPITKQYEFLEMIGRLDHQMISGKGSFSEVYRARSIHSGKIRAIKKIFRKSPKIQQSIVNQFGILKEMDHPNILKMYELFSEQSHYYITTELCTGAQLFDVIIKQKFFKQTKAKQIFYQILLAVKFMQQNHSVMHRDLKPENIMYDIEAKSLKIVDFGSAIRFKNNQLKERRRIGTSYYIAPEVLKKLYNQKCDMWSLGVILYIILSGQPPFKGKNDDQILENVLKAPLTFAKPIWNVITQNAKDLITKLLTKNPLTRLSAKQATQHTWFKSLMEQSQKGNQVSEIDQKNLESALQNMKRFKDIKSSCIQQGILVFIVNFVQTSEDQKHLLKCFKTLDLNNDGVMSLEELKLGLAKHLNMEQKDAHLIATKIFKKVDTNQSGAIDYSQFLLAASNLEITVSQENLDMAFGYLDEDKSGKLSAKEFRKKLGENVSEQKYENLLKKFDLDSDGEINKEEFTQMMRCLLKL